MQNPTIEEIRKRWLCHKDGSPIVRTHYEGCWADHRDCVIALLCDEVDRLQDELAKTRNERDCK